MFRSSIPALLLVLIVSATAVAQKNEANPEVVLSEGRASKKFFEPNNPSNDKKELIEITGIGSTTFTASNSTDGTSNSYKHFQKIVVGLVSPSKTSTYQLIFYSANAEIPYAASEEAGKTSIYFPIAMYAEIREKMEQSFAARKKVMMNVSLLRNGVREGSLVL